VDDGVHPEDDNNAAHNSEEEGGGGDNAAETSDDEVGNEDVCIVGEEGWEDCVDTAAKSEIIFVFFG
jgi:hypothetical protein